STTGIHLRPPGGDRLREPARWLAAFDRASPAPSSRPPVSAARHTPAAVTARRRSGRHVGPVPESASPRSWGILYSEGTTGSICWRLWPSPAERRCREPLLSPRRTRIGHRRPSYAGPGIPIRAQEGLDLGTQLKVVAAGAGEIRRPIIGARD